MQAIQSAISRATAESFAIRLNVKLRNARFEMQDRKDQEDWVVCDKCGDDVHLPNVAIMLENCPKLECENKECPYQVEEQQ